MTDQANREYVKVTDAMALLGISRPTLKKKLTQLGNVQTYQGLDKRETLIERAVIDRLTRIEPKKGGHTQTTQ